MDPRAGLDRCGKSRPPPGFDPRTVQPVASRYTDSVIAAHIGQKNTTLLLFFNTMQDEITRKWRKLHNEEINFLYSSTNIVWVIISRRIR